MSPESINKYMYFIVSNRSSTQSVCVISPNHSQIIINVNSRVVWVYDERILAQVKQRVSRNTT